MYDLCCNAKYRKGNKVNGSDVYVTVVPIHGNWLIFNSTN